MNARGSALGLLKLLYDQQGWMHGLSSVVFLMLGALIATGGDPDPWSALFESPHWYVKTISISALLYTGTILISLAVMWTVQSLSSPGTRLARYVKTVVSAGVEQWHLADARWRGFDKIVEVWPAPNLFVPDAASQTGGWRPTDCTLHLMGKFAVSNRLTDYHSRFIEGLDPQERSKDWPKFMLVNHPESKLDAHLLRLEVAETVWSVVKSAYLAVMHEEQGRELLFRCVDPKRQSDKPPVLDLTKNQFPNSFCLHGIVVTSDNCVLALKRPRDTDYYPEKWSFSFEEQLAAEDLEPRAGPNATIETWVWRSVMQEVLGNEYVDEYFNVADARVLSVALEDEACGPFLVVLIPISCSSDDLPAILRTAPDRQEACDHRFFSLGPPFDDLVRAYRRDTDFEGTGLHPTSRYRILMMLTTLFPRYGVEKLLSRSV